jgi:hypothetical protein
MMKKAARIAIGVFALWIVFLVIFGFAYSGRAGERVANRLGESMMAKATVGSSSLSLVRGWVELDDLRVRKDDLGLLEIDIGHIECDLLPMGLALIDRSCGDLVIDKVRLTMTSASVLQMKRPKRKPLRVDRVEIRDAVLTFMPSAFLPDLGKIEIRVDYVEAGPTTFKTPLSWIFSMRELRATLDLPADIVLTLQYANGALTVQGSVFGSAPVTLPVSLPTANSADDAKAEMAKLVTFAKDLAEDLLETRAKNWLKSKLPF